MLNNHTVNVQWSDHYNPDRGLMVLDTSALGLDNTLHQYERNEMDSAEVARAIIRALFARDFLGNGSHWSGDGVDCSEVVSGGTADDINSDNDEKKTERTFQCSESSTWDWKDIYAVAKSKAKITLSEDRKEIRVEDYSFYCSG